jgi:hypothetical protein
MHQDTNKHTVGCRCPPPWCAPGRRCCIRWGASWGRAAICGGAPWCGKGAAKQEARDEERCAAMRVAATARRCWGMLMRRARSRVPGAAKRRWQGAKSVMPCPVEASVCPLIFRAAIAAQGCTAANEVHMYIHHAVATLL